METVNICGYETTFEGVNITHIKSDRDGKTYEYWYDGEEIVKERTSYTYRGHLFVSETTYNNSGKVVKSVDMVDGKIVVYAEYDSNGKKKEFIIK